jgi:hypothetical protein
MNNNPFSAVSATPGEGDKATNEFGKFVSDHEICDI